MSDLVGKQFGNYHLIRFLGEGNFAEVYVGEHVRLNTLAAIKVLHTRLTKFETGDFLTEARTVANLDHRNIVRVLDFDVEGDIPFLVLEYAPNGSLRERHPRGTRLPSETIISFVKQIAGGLQYAHDKKLIHRDVKPENILLKINNELLLSDFGLATIVRSTQSLSIDQLAGTPYYMAPEQIQGKTRRASDQYALGIIVYEWISGTPPFTGSLRELIAQHQFVVPPPPHEKVPDFPPAIEQVVMKALAKDPEDRYPCVQDFADVLETAILHNPFDGKQLVATTPPSGTINEDGPTVPLSKSYITPAFVAEPLASKILDAPTFSPSQIPSQNISRRKFPRREVVKWGVVIGIGTVTAATIIELAALALGARQPSVSTIKPSPHATGSPQPFGTRIYTYLPNVFIPHAVFSVSWSPNGKRIASGWQDNTARVWDATTKHNVLPYNKHSGEVKSVAWSPDSAYIASGSADKKVRIWNATSGLDILTLPYALHTAKVRSVDWSPDSAYIASGSEDHTVRVWNAKTGTDKPYSPITGHTGTVFSVAWSPDGKYIASGSEDHTVKVWYASTGKIVLTYSGHSNRVNSVAWSPNGKYIASGSYDNTVHVWDSATGGNKFIYNRHTKPVEVLAWSHDGTRIASGGNDATVQVWDALTGANVRTYRGHSKSNPVWSISWSPDGRYIASGSFDETVQVWWAT
ncbi:MAG: protein kinase domain-containing protein [Ktedonobacteraceae bacterium]